MLLNRSYRLRQEILWLFRRASRKNKTTITEENDFIVSQMPWRDGVNAFQIKHMFCREGQYQPHLLFNGRIYARFDTAELMMKAMHDGLSNRYISRELGVSAVTVNKLRRIIVDEYHVECKKCECGKEASHWGRCDQGKGRTGENR